MRTILPGELETKDLHQFIVGAIAPRPVAFASTIDERGIANIAPYSFFNAFSSNPPILVFSSNRTVRGNTTKDTLHNIQKNKEVVIHAVNYAIVRQMAIASISYPATVDEFQKAGLTAIAATTVQPFRIKESPAQFECKVQDIITLGQHGGAGHLIICNVQCMHIAEEVIDSRGRINPHRLDLVGRLGRAYYVRASGDAIFDVYQAASEVALGFDQLPDSIRNSPILTGNDLAQIAGQKAFPSAERIRKLKREDTLIQNLLLEYAEDKAGCLLALHQKAKQLIQTADTEKAFALLMLGEEME